MGINILQILRNINEAIGVYQTLVSFIQDDLALVLNKISEIKYKSAIKILEDDLPPAKDKLFQVGRAVISLSEVYDFNLDESKKYKSSSCHSFEQKRKVYECLISTALLISLCYQYPVEDGEETSPWDEGMSRQFALRARNAFYEFAKLTIDQSEEDDEMKYRALLDDLKDAEVRLIDYCSKIKNLASWKPICNFQEASENIKQAETTLIPRQVPAYSPRNRYGGGSYRTEYIPHVIYKTVTIRRYKLVGQWTPPYDPHD